MSLNVYLTIDGATDVGSTSEAIFVRRNGGREQISQEEWNQLNPDVKAVTTEINSNHRYITKTNKE